MAVMKDLTGQIFGRLTILVPCGKDKKGNYLWLCSCACGKEVKVSSSNLISGHTTSCGCIKKEGEAKKKQNTDTRLIGLVVNGITFISRAGKNKHGTYLWVCKCYCGTLFETVPQNIFQGTVKSCGCLVIETRGMSSRTHGMSKTVLYRRWSNMHERCRSDSKRVKRNYKDRGITVCEEWSHFEPFYEWAQKNKFTSDLELDRIDNNSGYSPENCRWATRKQQARNTSVNRLVCYNGEEKLVIEWAEEYNISEELLRSRLFKLGWSMERALKTPVQYQAKKKKEKV